jgi:hypothetical protein
MPNLLFFTQLLWPVRIRSASVLTTISLLNFVFMSVCYYQYIIHILIEAHEKSVKKHSLTRAEALSGGLPPRFGGCAEALIVQTVLRAVNEVENGRRGRCSTGGAASQERLGGMDFTGDREEKGIGAD